MYISMFVLRLKHMLRFLEKSITEYPIMNDIFAIKNVSEFDFVILSCHFHRECFIWNCVRWRLKILFPLDNTDIWSSLL